MKIGLALSGGGILGAAHLGVLKELQNNNIKVDIISGTSIGAMAGALYSAGGIEMIEKFLKSFKKQNRVARKLFMIFNDNVMESASKALHECLGDIEFSDLKVKFICIATDLATGEMVVLDKGKVADAVLASCAYPGILPVKQIGKQYFIDGGMICTLPAKVLRDLGADFVIGSSLYEIGKMTSKELKELTKSKDRLNARIINIIFHSISMSEHQSCDFCFTHPLGKYNWLEVRHMTPAQNVGEVHAKKNFQRLLEKIQAKEKSLSSKPSSK